ncbi:putative DNA primase large subunit protein [Marine Group I thaumarchaeote SCGC RSA3]|uniref:DNA primase large subunit PriL n=3 Tax=Marine Group I TaxID=905826 RepID=A0A081RQC1_9ARCH|nr:putative DNA primase large subunit protein [Marine Group I thaumarchaeote SCGC AAA799-N04]KFM14473.1 putative DNA primase large subunit protein [Marine Group I thaumarchaeote SCGC AAA799-D11]KFM20669.1 putative DNA primase large subunit protein [Marine Group I thaumarchaeote SCGC RSA3]
MLSLGQDEIAKYPFLADAGQYLKDKGFTLEQFGTDPDLKELITKAYERIQVAADGKIYKSDLVGDQVSREAALPREVFSFLLAIVLLKLSGMHTLIKRFALAEARRAEKYLEKDLANISDESKKQLAIRIIDDLFSVQIEKLDDYFVIPVSDYLKHSINFHEREWKLINRHVEKGQVFLTPHETVRLIRKELGTYINSKIVNAKTPTMIPGFEDSVNKLVMLSKKFSTFTMTTGEYPPCIKHAIDVLEKGENLPHSGRFMLATFLLSKGQSVQQIAPLFKNAPDYNERVTLYQLNHLAGTSGSGTQYSCPSCEKLKTQSLCFATSECEGIITPLQFGKKRK